MFLSILLVCGTALFVRAEEPRMQHGSGDRVIEVGEGVSSRFLPNPSDVARYRVERTKQSSVHTDARALRPKADYEIVDSPKLMRYRTQADYPDYNAGSDGNGIEVPENGSAPRSDAAIGIETGWINGGGCFPANPADPTSPCLTETDASGNSSLIYKARERWTFRMSYIDPIVSNAPEINIGFPGSFGYVGDDELVWVRETSAGRRCFTFYSYYCNTYGIDLDYITGSVRGFQPNCSHKRGPGYKGQIFYQYSRYKITDTIPPGANEWEPATVAATPTRLDKPGKEIWVRHWELDMGENAVNFSVFGPIHPAIEAGTGYDTVAPTVAPAVGSVNVSAYDCGPIPGVSFTISNDFVAGTSGHAHTAPPSLGEIATLGSTSGTTDADGKWTTTLTTGRIASTIRLTAIGTIEGNLFGKTANVGVGFFGLVDPGANDPNIRYTGYRTNHPINHYGSSELHQMLRDAAAIYVAQAEVAKQGSVGLNDMSLVRGGLFDIAGTWTPSHYRHRFGTDCDIDQAVLRADGTFVTMDKTLFRSVIEDDLGGIFLLESLGRMHVQVPEFQVGDILLREAR